MRPRPSSWDTSPKGDTSTWPLDGSKSLSCPPTLRRTLSTGLASVTPESPSAAPDFAASFPITDGVCSGFAGMCWITSESAGAQAQTAHSASDATTKNVECISKTYVVLSAWKTDTVRHCGLVYKRNDDCAIYFPSLILHTRRCLKKQPATMFQ